MIIDFHGQKGTANAFDQQLSSWIIQLKLLEQLSCLRSAFCLQVSAAAWKGGKLQASLDCQLKMSFMSPSTHAAEQLLCCSQAGLGFSFETAAQCEPGLSCQDTSAPLGSHTEDTVEALSRALAKQADCRRVKLR